MDNNTQQSSAFRLKTLFNYLATYLKYGIVGNTVRLEASTVCQLKCPVCPTGKGEMGVLGRGHLKFDDFKKFIEQYPFIKNVELSNYGEIFLNPELLPIMRYAFEKDIHLTGHNGVNLNNAKEEVLEGVVKYRVKELLVAIDGATADTYQIYRQRGNFDSVIANVKRINFYKDKYASTYPRLRWQFIVFGHNEHEIPKAQELAKELNMEFTLKRNWSSTYSPIKDQEPATPPSTPATVGEKTQSPFCKQLWLSPQINWDGKLVGCCVNNTVEFGNVFVEGLAKCMKSEKYRYMQEMLLGRKEPREDLPCYNCGEFRNRQTVYRNLKIFENPLSVLWFYTGIGLAIDRNIGKVGIFLRKHSPSLYEILAKIIKKK